MSKFWQKKYTSKYTGAEIDAAVAKAGDATKVTANPTLAGTESALEGLQVGDTKYKVGGGSDIFVFYVSEDENTGDPVFSKTFNEISAAISDGKIPVGFCDPSDTPLKFPEGLFLYSYNPSSTIIFQNVSFDFDEAFAANRNIFELASDNTLTYTYETYTWTATPET